MLSSPRAKREDRLLPNIVANPASPRNRCIRLQGCRHHLLANAGKSADVLEAYFSELPMTYPPHGVTRSSSTTGAPGRSDIGPGRQATASRQHSLREEFAPISSTRPPAAGVESLRPRAAVSWSAQAAIESMSNLSHQSFGSWFRKSPSEQYLYAKSLLRAQRYELEQALETRLRDRRNPEGKAALTMWLSVQKARMRMRAETPRTGLLSRVGLPWSSARSSGRSTRYAWTGRPEYDTSFQSFIRIIGDPSVRWDWRVEAARQLVYHDIKGMLTPDDRSRLRSSLGSPDDLAAIPLNDPDRTLIVRAFGLAAASRVPLDQSPGAHTVGMSSRSDSEQDERLQTSSVSDSYTPSSSISDDEIANEPLEDAFSITDPGPSEHLQMSSGGSTPYSFDSDDEIANEPLESSFGIPDLERTGHLQMSSGGSTPCSFDSDNEVANEPLESSFRIPDPGQTGHLQTSSGDSAPYRSDSGDEVTNEPTGNFFGVVDPWLAEHFQMSSSASARRIFSSVHDIAEQLHDYLFDIPDPGQVEHFQVDPDSGASSPKSSIGNSESNDLHEALSRLILPEKACDLREVTGLNTQNVIDHIQDLATKPTSELHPEVVQALESSRGDPERLIRKLLDIATAKDPVLSLRQTSSVQRRSSSTATATAARGYVSDDAGSDEPDFISAQSSICDRSSISARSSVSARSGFSEDAASGASSSRIAIPEDPATMDLVQDAMSMLRGSAGSCDWTAITWGSTQEVMDHVLDIATRPANELIPEVRVAMRLAGGDAEQLILNLLALATANPPVLSRRTTSSDGP